MAKESKIAGLETGKAKQKTGIELIAAERSEQIVKHKKSLQHDRAFKNGQLSYHAAILATPTVFYQRHEFANATQFSKAN